MGRKKTLGNSVKPVGPDFLYKYSPIDSISPILNGLSIKVTDPTKFNDPFDCNVPQLDLDKIDLLGMLKREYGKGLGAVNDPVFLREMNRLRPLFSKMAEEVRQQTSDLAKNWDVLLSHFRVLSLTKRPDNILMWSHYARYHEGAVLKFDAKAPAFNGVLKVRYGVGAKLMNMFLDAATTDLARLISQNRPDTEVDKKAVEMSNKNYELLFRYLLIKRQEWEYEEEYRLILNANDSRVNHDPQCQLDTVSFEANDLREVIFGANAKAKDIKEVEDLVRTKFPDVKITQARKRGLDLVVLDEIMA